MLDTFDRIASYFMDLVAKRAILFFGQKSATPANLQRTARVRARRARRPTARKLHSLPTQLTAQ